jgi:glycosyltransferase involved in cell wall biosynthesis
MKIMIAVHHFPPNYTGGAEWRAYRTALEMQARGYQVRVVCVEKINQSVNGYLEWEDELFDGINVRRMFYDLRSAKDPFQMTYDNQWISEHIEGILQEDPPDVFHLIGGYLMSGSVLQAARRQAVPIVVSLTDFFFLCPRITFLSSSSELCKLPLNPVRCARCIGEESRRWRIPGKMFPQVMNLFWSLRRKTIKKFIDRNKFLLKTLNLADVIISPSEFLKSTHISAGIHPDRIIYVRQGRYLVENLNGSAISRKNANELKIGYLGQIVHHKGLHTLIEAVRMLPGAPISLKIYGNPNSFSKYSEVLTKMIGEDRRIEMAGIFQRENLGEVMNEFDVVVVPSIWYENSPNAILEAFAYKTPVIATNLGGMAELVHHNENGLLFERENANSLREQIRRLLDEPQLLEQLRAGIQPVKSVQVEMDELEEIYQCVTGKYMPVSSCLNEKITA